MIERLILDATDLLRSGRVLEALLYPFLSVLGDWFYLFIYGMIYIGVYLKTRDVAVPSVLGLVMSFILYASAPPSAYIVVHVLLAVSIAGVVYRAYRGEGG